MQVIAFNDGLDNLEDRALEQNDIYSTMVKNFILVNLSNLYWDLR